MATKKVIIIGFMVLTILASAIYITLNQDVRIRVDEDKATFYIFNENSRWEVAGREYNRLFNGTSLSYRDIQAGINITHTTSGNWTFLVRATKYKNGASIIDRWEFLNNVSQVELFPIAHYVAVVNGKGLFYRYSLDELEDTGNKRKFDGTETYAEFGDNMKVEVNPDYRWCWIGYPYGSDSMACQYDIKSNYEVFKFRFFDPKEEEKSNAITINPTRSNPAIQGYSMNIIAGDVVITGSNWSASFQPQFYLSNGNLLDWSQIPANIQKNLWKKQISTTKWKYGVDFSNIYTAQKDALQNVVLHRVASENLTWNDVRLEGSCIVVSANQPEVRLCHDDILRTYSIPLINKTDIVIGNLDNTWTVCDSQPITDPDQPYWCAQNHTEGNWAFDTQSGTWSITFDPTITIDAPDVVNDALMSDVVAEGNCSHLAIDYSQAPFTNLMLYLPFDCDSGNNESTVHDWSNQGQDGSLYGYSTKDPYLEPNGRYGTALNSTRSVWNVKSDCVVVTDNALLDFTSTEYFSISSWIYYDGMYTTFISKHDGSTGFVLLGNDGVGGYLRVTGASDYVFGKIGLNQWHHIVAGRNASQTFVFVDGTYSGGAADASPNDLSNAVDFVLTGDTSPSYKCAGSANGMIDEVMIFNKSLSFSEVAEIYNNQSNRFKETGTFDYANQSILGGLATGFDTVNVSTEMQNLSASAIGLSVGYYDGLGWGYTSPQNITNHTNYTFYVDSTTTNLTLNYTFYAGNISTSWYSPLMFPQQVGDIVVTTETVAGGDSCDTCSMDCSEYCTVDSEVDCAGGNWVRTGWGAILVDAPVINWVNRSTHAGCNVTYTSNYVGG